MDGERTGNVRSFRRDSFPDGVIADAMTPSVGTVLRRARMSTPEVCAMVRHRRLLVALLGALAALTTACGGGGAAAAATPSSPPAPDQLPQRTEPSWLFVVDAEAGTADGTNLTLTGVDPVALAFADRPVRAARTVPVAGLAESWQQLGFAADPPNAALTAEVDGKQRTSAVTLTGVTYDPAAGTLTVSYTPLATKPEELHRVGGAHEEPAARFGRAALFVDAGGTTVGTSQGQATITAISKDEYQQLLGQAQNASRVPCVTPSASSTQVCTLVTVTGTGTAAWTVIAQAPDGDQPLSTAADLQVQTAAGTEYEASIPLTYLRSQWVKIVWESPAIGIPGIGADLVATVTVEPAGQTTATCFVQRTLAGSFTYICT